MKRAAVGILVASALIVVGDISGRGMADSFWRDFITKGSQAYSAIFMAWALYLVDWRKSDAKDA